MPSISQQSGKPGQSLVYVSVSQTFLNDFAGFIQHALNLTTSHIDESHLRHKQLIGIVACTDGTCWMHSQQKRHVMFPET